MKNQEKTQPKPGKPTTDPRSHAWAFANPVWKKPQNPSQKPDNNTPKE